MSVGLERFHCIRYSHLTWGAVSHRLFKWHTQATHSDEEMTSLSLSDNMILEKCATRELCR